MGTKDVRRAPRARSVRDYLGRTGHDSQFDRRVGGRTNVRRRGWRLDGRRRRLDSCGSVRDGGRCLLMRRLGCGQAPRRQQPQRVDVALLVARRTDAEVHIRLCVFGDAARTDAADDRAFADARAPRDRDRPEMQERSGVAERCLDGNCLAAGRHRARERHHPFDRRQHLCARLGAEVDAAMLARRVRMCSVERKRAQYRTVDRPGPRLCRRNWQRQRADDQNSETPHDFSSSVVRFVN